MTGQSRLFRLPRQLGSRLTRLRRDTSAVALIEFALSLPLLVGLTMVGTECAMYVQAHMKTSQVALAIADNISRVGEDGTLVQRRINESDITDILTGGGKQSSDPDFYQQARVVISSVQFNAANQPRIAWQRCRGTLNYVSPFYTQAQALGTSPLTNGITMPDGTILRPIAGSALIFVEIEYRYDALFGIAPFADDNIQQQAFFNVREVRDLTGVFNSTGATLRDDCAVRSALPSQI